MKHLVPLHSVGVHRDITTTLYPHVCEHEIPILQAIHGESNVYPGEPTGDVTRIDIDGEYDRMGRKYGDDAVRTAYGATGSGDIKRQVAANATGTEEEDDGGIVLEGPDSKPKAKAEVAKRGRKGE